MKTDNRTTKDRQTSRRRPSSRWRNLLDVARRRQESRGVHRMKGGDDTRGDRKRQGPPQIGEGRGHRTPTIRTIPTHPITGPTDQGAPAEDLRREPRSIANANAGIDIATTGSVAARPDSPKDADLSSINEFRNFRQKLWELSTQTQIL